MSNSAQLTAAELESRAEDRIAARVIACVLVFVLAVAIAVFFWGLPALTMIALAGALLVMILLVAYAAGF